MTMDPSQLKYIFGGAAALLLGAGLLRRPHRWSLWVSAACAGAAAAAAHHDAFWTMAMIFFEVSGPSPTFEP